MSKFEVGDIVKALPEADHEYSVTNTSMNKAVVVGINDGRTRDITIKCRNNTYDVNSKYFEKIRHQKPFNRSEVIAVLAEGKKDALEGYDLIGADLSGVNLRRADLREADLSGADLSGADLRLANLREADLSRADLSAADLSAADLSDANLSGANLSGADMRNANLRRADLKNADLRRTDLRNADLSGADLSDADLSDADLSATDLSQTKGLLDAIDFMEAHFERTSEGYIVYKSFGAYRSAPESWDLKPGSIISENVNANRSEKCGSGINVAPLDWVLRDNCKQPYKLLIRFEWLVDVVVPYNTDGNIRCGRAEIIGPVEE